MSHITVSTRRNGRKVEYQMHELLISNLEICKSAVKKNMNFNGLISGDGKTRTGKTTTGVQCACYLDHSFLDNWKERMVYDWELIEPLANKLKPGQVIIYDEARDVLNSAQTMTNYCQRLLTFFSRCGSKNLFIIVILPDFFDLPKSLAIVQSHFLINCYFRNGFDRGFFDFFNDNQKKYLYIMGKKFLDYKAAKPSFKGTFTKFFPINEKEYEEHKQSEFARINAEKVKKGENLRTVIKQKQRVRLLIETLMGLGVTQTKCAEILGIQQGALSREYMDPRFCDLLKEGNKHNTYIPPKDILIDK